jgi:phage gpG-like protein
MVTIRYNKGQMDNFKRSLEGARKRMIKGVREIIYSSIMDVGTTAKQPGYVPYKRGHLRRSINWKMEPSETKVIGYVGSNLDYAAIQEFGGQTGRNHATKITGRFYFTRSIKDNTQKIKDRFCKAKKL